MQQLLSSQSKFKDQSISMEFHILLEFVGTLGETQNIIFFKNGKLMTYITLLTLLINSLFYIFNIFSIKPLIRDFLTEQNLVIAATPGSPEFANIFINMKRDLGIFVGVEWIYLLVNSIISLFLATVTISASAMAFRGSKDMTFKTLLLRAARSWKRPCVTWFYTTLLCTGYICLLLAILFPLSLIIQRPGPLFSALHTVLFVVASILYVYMTVIWTLALVISVLEEMYGIEALGKAAQIVKGMKIHGFLLNLVFITLSCVLVQGLRLISYEQPLATKVIIGFVVISFISLVRLVWLVAYSIFYYQCKKIHGEDQVELQENVGYTKIPTTAPILSENIP
ncbi:hypothetical protein P3X46_022607 [Hevea brasiliensis]|uniref:Transmembrane protein n=1 Tax=Hevea brasiliensis TaxID=3981 RepID=A0ABQ9LBQ1_HEVBR|nr:uncharacterized protein LOC131171879 [Hevea brasiliensis]KAJ9162865.1 hypothetical protein P3X46_022607 [Hevea brasiliensis]